MTNAQRNQNNQHHNEWQGDIMPAHKPDDAIRVMFHNVNHLALHGNVGFDSFIQAQSDLQVDIQAFSEHCLDTTKFRVCHQAQTILRNTYQQQATVQLNSSAEPAINDYKPGGTGIMVLGELASRLEPSGKGGDRMGRWSFMSFRRKHFPPLTVVSVYQVCPRPTNAIGNTAYHQQQRALAKQGCQLHPRQAFIRDLQTFLESLRDQQHDILVGGDFNESLNDRNSGILQIANRLQLVDPFLSKFPHHNEFGTHISGKRRIDLVLVSPGILPGIQMIGYAPYEFATSSDHRPVVLEIKKSVFSGTQATHTIPESNRVLKTNDKKAVVTYINELYDYLSRHQVFQLATSVEDDSATSATVEHLDNLLGNGANIAEKQCHTRRPEYYSRTIVRQRFEVATLKQHLRALRLDRDIRQQLESKMQRTGIHVPLPPTQALTRVALKAARDQLIKTRQTSFETRQAELDKKIQEASEARNRPKHKILSAIRKVESNLRTFRILKAMKRKNAGISQLDRLEIPASWPTPSHTLSSVQQLEDPKTCREWRLVTEPQDVEYYLLLRNRIHFGQAEGTPFTEHELSAEFNWQATTSSAEKVLEGSYSTSSTNIHVQAILQECQARAPLDSIPNELTYDEFRGKIRSWRESTTTSPSGRHLGRYKALFTPVLVETEESNSPTTTIADKQESIARLILAIINYCLRNTYVLERWKTVINVMIFKEVGNFQIHRLRVIHIYEADLNAILAVKWRNLLRFADAAGTINEGQYGGRPGCEAQSVTLLEELKYDLSYLTRRSLFNFDNDATSCYDRIVVPLASIVSRKYGQHRKTVALHASTLQQAQFRLKTANGLSDGYYSHCKDFPIHGTGQGSGNSPSIWLFLSSTLFDAHKIRAHGTRFASPCGRHQLHITMVGFVDDSTGSCNDFQPQAQAPKSELFRMMQHDAQLWNDYLHCSGGKLELTKCSFHFLHFDFTPNGTPKPDLTRYDNCIHLRDATKNVTIPIAAKTALETHKTLGHHKSPYVSKHDISRLSNQAKQIALTIVMSPVNRQGAFLAYNAVFIPTIKYTLPQSFYPRKILDQAQAPSLQLILPKCGFNRNTAREIIFASQEYAGGGFLPWYLLQGEGQVIQFVKHWRTNTVVSSTLRMAMCWAQWQSGHSSPILSDVHTPLPHLECRWIKSLRNFLSHTSASIHIDTPFLAPAERSNDTHIMTYAITCGLFNDEDLRILNYCRLYAHVTTLSELFEADGKTVNYYVFQCQREPWFDATTYVTLQRRPNDHSIRTKWQKLCRHWVTSEGFLAASQDLGSWLVSGEQLRRRRETYMVRDDPSRLFHWRLGRYWEYQISKDHEGTYIPLRPSSWEPKMPCSAVFVRRHSTGVVVLSSRVKSTRLQKSLPIPQTFHQHVLTLTPWEQHLLLGINLLRGPYEILHHLSREEPPGTLLIVSDGSQKADQITYGWVAGDTEGLVFAEHAGYGYGTPTSHRAEAWGLLSALAFIYQLQQYTKSSFSQLLVPIATFSDNAGLIQRCQKRQQYSIPYPNSTLDPDWDLIEQIHETIRLIDNDNLACLWVRGHQDETTGPLAPEAKFNVRADYLASTVTTPRTSARYRSPWLLPAERCQVAIGGKSIHAHYASEIRRVYTVAPLMQYLQRRYQWPPKTEDTVDWKSYTQAVSMVSFPKHQLTKLVFDKLPTRYELAKASRHTSAQCPYCGETEKFSHILQCKNPASNKFRHDLGKQVGEYFDRHDVPMQFREEFFQSLTTQILHPGEASGAPEVSKLPATMSQDQIGWGAFAKGFWTKAWRETFESQRRRFMEVDEYQTTQFIAGLIHILWQRQYALWQEYIRLQGTSRDYQALRFQGKRAEYVSRIRLLHQDKTKCLQQHQGIYFHDDVESFIATATNYQLHQYLFLYEPAISQSIKDAKKIPMRTILSFPGYFSRQRRTTADTNSRATPTLDNRYAPLFKQVASHRWQPSSSGTKHDPPYNNRHEGAHPHKHTRWKTIPSANGIHKYFSQLLSPRTDQDASLDTG